MSNGFFSSTKEGTLLRLRVSPGARRSSVEGTYGEDALKLRVAAPPVDGKANAETEAFLAGLVGVPRSFVTVTRGVSSRDKVVLFRGLEAGKLRGALADHLP